MDKNLLQTYLSDRYQGSRSFLENIIFPIFGEDSFEDGHETEFLNQKDEYRKTSETLGIRSVRQVGKIEVGVEPLYIFDVTVSDRVRMERNRVGIQRLVRSIMGTYSCAFMLFHYENDVRWDWRFTFCHISGDRKTATDSKRYTFLLGPEQSCHTAGQNFMKLYEKHGPIEVKDIENAFNVEALSNEFFGKYKSEYDSFVEYITGKRYVKKGGKYVEAQTHAPHPTLYPAFGGNDKLVRDYVKKLLGRIVFLHFLQKKGWLGVPAGKDWGDGDRSFMLHLFENASEEQKDSFLDEVLEGLFADGLDCDRSDRNDLYDTKVEGFRNCRIPYLNGGLFERDPLDEKTVKFPAEYFDSLLTMLSRYNFTIDENDPDDAEVGIDPEMLGRIFENLLEDNKDKGAFYTPKEIVQYMCRESLIAYLQTGQTEEDRERIRRFVTTHDGEQLDGLKGVLDQKLRDVKICDPAIGSGAFPMGLLRELFLCRAAIEPDVAENAADIKRHIIQNNIYGVDIERGAVDIARLRFWLSLIVDEKSPEALPNLDFKIMQGNSLLEQYKGVDLSAVTGRKEEAEKTVTFFGNLVDDSRRQLCERLDEYYACPEHTQKVELRKQIAEIVKQELVEQGITVDFGDIDLAANSQFFLWHTWFHDVFSRPSKEGGFDITIGNPPYISAPTQIASPELNEQRQRIVACKKYKSLNEKWDLYVPFMELGLQLLSPNGVFSMIVPYPLTNQKYGKKLRKMIVEEYCLLEIADLNGTKIFENATVSNCIPFIQNSSPKGELRITQLFGDKTFRNVLRKSPETLKQDENKYVWNLTEERRTGNRFANMNVLGDFCYISKGMVLNANENIEKGAFKKEDLISNIYDEVHCRKYIEAKDIDKYQVKRVRFLEWNTERCPDKLSRQTFRELYDCPKLIMNCLGTINVTIDTEEHFLHNHSIYCAILWKDLKGVNNKSISSSIKKFCKHTRAEMEALSGEVDLLYLLGVLNSSMAGQLLADQRGGDYHIYPEHIRNLPIPIATPKQQEGIAQLVRIIMEKIHGGQDSEAEQQKVNQMVSALYI
ncbi:Eco57I restriction-modification methylase domain-containing protein [Prevotella denticola]|uniref:site-specific DNA-methyltransferase (adenine-specific) n=2 Tax=Prevotella denticola TaxID=28129 RepID=A0A379ECP8_9BACT|nr:N-6 DNA methylase [Prevotella denticola]SUB94167.1 Type IIS restriction enzyme Eco57I [Prevotella denticola]